MDDNLWLIELESALMDDCNVNELYTICRGKAIPEALRPDVWQLCLDVRHKPDQMAAFNEIFDLPFQQELRTDCAAIVEKLGNDDEERVSVASDLESILTFYCKTRQFAFETGNGWIELLLPLLSLKLSRSYTYNLFEAIRDAYIPRGCVKNGNVFHVFRLLILYHDPELCSLLDTKRIAADQYAMMWFRSLFAATCPFEVVLAMWDQYFQHSDPFLVFFLALIMLINGRDRILEMAGESREAIVAFLANMPCALEPDDVVDFCALAQYYSLKTPASFKTDYLHALFGGSSLGGGGLAADEVVVEPADCVVSQALCLPVSVYELVENAAADMPHPDAVRFFLVDCRPAEHYNTGHLSTAFHLDSNLMLQEPDAFATAVQGLLRSQRQALEANSCAGGEHLCFMGSGRLDEDQYMYMAVASFLQKGTQFVSLLTGGYNAIHEYFGENMADCLEDHDAERCLVCCKEGQLSASNNNNHHQSPNYQSSGNDTNDNVHLRNRPPPSTSSQSQSSRSNAPNNSTTTTTATSNPSRSSSSSDLFSKWSAAMKTKSAEVKGKLLDYIVNPNTAANGGASVSSVAAPANKASSAAGRAASHPAASTSTAAVGHSDSYRNMASVFSIDEDQEDSVISDLPPSRLSHVTSNSGSGQSGPAGSAQSSFNASGASDQRELVQLAAFLKSPDVIKAYKCHEVHMNGDMFDSQLIVADTHLVVVRELGKRGEAQVIVRRPMSSIVKITAKKKQRDLITFKYGLTHGDSLVVTDMDRFLIPNASGATALVSQQIIRQLEAAEAASGGGSGSGEGGADEREEAEKRALKPNAAGEVGEDGTVEDEEEEDTSKDA